VTTDSPTNATDGRDAVPRILAALDDRALVEKLSARLSSADLTTLLLAVVRRRASALAAPPALARHRRDRFAQAGTTPFDALRRAEDTFVHTLRAPWEWVVLSPVVPFGTHHVLGRVSQDWVVTTVRGSEVAGDPTVGLALEAADRRRTTEVRRSGKVQRLAAIQRVLRAQQYASDDAFSHFTLLGLVTAGRSVAGGSFDVEALREQLSVYVTVLRNLVDQVEIVLSVGRGERARRLVAVVREARATRRVIVTEDPERLHRQRYYVRACFKVNVEVAGERFEVADGGFTDWTERLLDDRRERLLISGAGLDRLAIALNKVTS
jgi:hypothetical protein